MKIINSYFLILMQIKFSMPYIKIEKFIPENNAID